MTDPITPALTPKEWKSLDTADAFVQDGDLVVRTGWGSEDGSTPVNQHALAALALHQQPFGFTRADVELLDEAWCAVMGYHSGSAENAARLQLLRDRIAALLPPSP